MDFSLLQNSNDNEGVRRIDARLKVFIVFFYSISIFFVRSILGLTQFAVVGLIYIGFSKKIEFKSSTKTFKENLKVALKISFPIYIICALSFFSNALTLYGGSFYFTEDGIYKGTFFATRILLLTWFSLYIANTISLIEFTNVFKLCLFPLRKLKFPIDEASVTMSIALRFIPVVFREFQVIKEAHLTRGAKIDFGGAISRTRAYASCFIPLLVKMINSSIYLGRALESRCFGATCSNPRQDFEKISKLHLFLTIVIAITLFIVVVYL